MSENMEAGFTSKVGRRRDLFCWDNVKPVEGSKPRWRCNHCGEEYSGSAQRIRNHLAGQGNDIKACPKVDEKIRELAKMKRAGLAEPVAANNGVDHDEETSGIANNTTPSLATPADPVQPADHSLQSLAEAEFLDIADFPVFGGDTLICNDPMTSATWDTVNFNHTLSGETWAPAKQGHPAPDNLIQVSSSSNQDITDKSSAYFNCNHPLPSVSNNVDAAAVQVSSSRQMFRDNSSDFFRRNYPLPSANNVQVFSSGACASLPNMPDEGPEMLMEAILDSNSPIDTFMSPRFRAILEAVAAWGPAAAHMFDSVEQLQEKLRSKFEAMVTPYIAEVAESGKTTGLTAMLYEIHVENQMVSWGYPHQLLVIGRYSPKGFCFTEGDRLPENDAIQYINHPFDQTTSECHYQTPGHPYHQFMWCVQDRIRRFCKDICNEEWVHTLNKRADSLYTYLMIPNQPPERKSIQAKLNRNEDGPKTSPTIHLISIMRLQHKIKQWERQITDQERPSALKSTGLITSIISDPEFWYKGTKLAEALTPLMKVYTFVDTLAPTAGYIHAKIEKANDVLESRAREGPDYAQIWTCFQNCFGDLTSQETEHAPSYLSPTYISTKAAGKLNLSDAGKDALKRIVDKEEHQALDVELEAYRIKSTNPLANIPYYQFKNDPIQLWEQYGSDQFPLLKKCAMKLLHQPMSCLCNQVKKCISEIQATDNFIARLNLKMKEEFKNKEAALNASLKRKLVF